MNLTRLLILALALAQLPILATAQPSRENAALTALRSSRENAAMATAFVAAFRCASLASYTKDRSEYDRLLSYGYRKGQQFASAFQSNKVSDEDLKQEPIRFLVLMRDDPSPDFVVGRVFERMEREVFVSLFGEASQDMQRLAVKHFRERNCSLIGSPD